MATTKAKNGNVTAEAMVDAADKMSEETKVFTDTWFEVSNKAAEETKVMLNTQQELLKDSWATWQKYNQTYFDFFAETTQQTMEEMLAFRERLGKSMENNLKKAQELMTAEQNIALESTNAFWAQAQATSERMIELFAPNWPK